MLDRPNVLHSMDRRERELALEVISLTWSTMNNGQASLLDAVRTEAAALPARYFDVSDDFAQHVGEAAVWYLDRATRRVGDPDRDGHSAEQREQNLFDFCAKATAADLERLFAVAAALNSDDF